MKKKSDDTMNAREERFVLLERLAPDRSDEELVGRCEKEYFQVYRTKEDGRYPDDVEIIREYLNMGEPRSEKKLFPWFRGEHYHVEFEDNGWKVRSGPAKKEREVFREQITSLIESNRWYVELLYNVLENRHDLLDRTVAMIPCFDGKAISTYRLRRDVIKSKERDGTAKHVVLSVSSYITITDIGRLGDIDGWDIHVDTLAQRGYTEDGQLVDGYVEIFIASELIPLIHESIRKIADRRIDEIEEYYSDPDIDTGEMFKLYTDIIKEHLKRSGSP